MWLAMIDSNPLINQPFVVQTEMLKIHVRFESLRVPLQMQTKCPSFVCWAAQWRSFVTQNTHCWCVLNEVFYRLPFKKRTRILWISVKNKINHMDILAIRYYRYVKEWLQLLDVHNIHFSWRNEANPIWVSLSVPNVLPLVAANSDFYFANRILRRHIHFMHVFCVQVHI